jgi:poly(3-hydroxybutyrate) depolymerase
MRQLIAFACFALIACGEPPSGSPLADAGPPPGPEISFKCPAEAPTISNGTAAWPFAKGADGADRSVHFLVPNTDPDTKLGVVYSWHGIGQDLDSWLADTRIDNDQPDFPFIVVSPHDTGMEPGNDPAGLYWDMFYSAPGDGNLEAALFETTLACLIKDFEIDTTRLYSVGFSGGAVITNLLTARYPDIFAATAPFSGAWFSDPVQEAMVDPSGVGADFFPGLGVDWNDLGAGKQTVLLTHGGAEDTYGLAGVEVISFENASRAAIAYLNDNGRNVIDCPHTAGHQPHPNIWVPDLVGFLKAHPWHQASPYADAMPEPYASAGCTFHAAR